MQNPTAWLLFALFGLILFVIYVALAGAGRPRS